MPAEAKGYSTCEAASIAGISYRQADHWERTGIMKPSVPARGSGFQRLYSYDDLVSLRAVAALRESGVSLHQAPRVLAALPTDADVLVVLGDLVVPVRASALAALLGTGREVCMVVSLRAVRAEVDRAIVRYRDTQVRRDGSGHLVSSGAA